MAKIVNNISISGYSPSGNYSFFDVIKSGHGNYFVSCSDNNSGNVPTGSNAYWKKFGDYTFRFNDVWIPSYDAGFNNDPELVETQLIGGVLHKEPYGENFHRQMLELSFKNRNRQETSSLMAFFEYMGAKFSFLCVYPEPYNISGYYVAKSPKVTFNGHNLYSISALFEESFNPIVSSGQSQDFYA